MVTREQRELQIEEVLAKVEREIIEVQRRMIAKRLRRRVSIPQPDALPMRLPTNEE